ncbi:MULTISPECIES: peptidoglycan DD-metalloendopeptidase family protein [unclassified Iodidimonas]|jgi:septal ring factor EnvC (AmiA/AmiB activator)|uniref:murein hydrolase activator EnvC family protein n=1 Tax=unclassified Iodidimonas TaxID=2626145 RepID=UPI00248302D4|nr:MULTISPECIES: peptidoglycan DD-metalloendopeptidase family protein [unclassified Iodidimonas]
MPLSILTGRIALTLLILGLGMACAVPNSAAQNPEGDPRSRLDAIEQELEQRAAQQRALAEKARSAGREAEAIARSIIAATADVQALEERVTAVALKIETVGDLLQEQESLLELKQDQMARTLAALQRLSRRPQALALLRPGDADETIKGAILLRELAPQLEDEARAVGQQVARILDLRKELMAERETLKADQKALEASRRDLEFQREARQAERQKLSQEAQEESRVMARLADQARSLEDLLKAIEAERARRLAAANAAAERLAQMPRTPEEKAVALAVPPASVPPSSAPLSEARGSLALPARGRLLRTFGALNGGLHEKGITIATLAGAQVVAPYDGRVVYSGPFRGYGKLLIIAHGEEYHTLLAGMDEVYASVGQWVLAGEPVGIMQDEARAVPQRAKTADVPAKNAQELYVELRKGGEPVDPVPWLAAGLGKVS